MVGDEAVAAYLRGATVKVEAAARESVGRIVLRLSRHVKAGKLTGQVLRVKTGTLRRSVSHAVTDAPGEVIGVVSTNVKYGRVHEYGFEGSQSVKAHMRTIKKAWGKALKQPKSVHVSGHARHVKLPERSFLRSALADLAPSVAPELSRAIAKAVSP